MYNLNNPSVVSCKSHSHPLRKQTCRERGGETKNSSMVLLYALLLLLLNSCTIFAIESISQTQFLQYPQTLVSKNNTFKLGFFTLPNSPNNHYLGIWFNRVPVKTFVWVANRDNPITDTSGVVKVSKNGNLQLLNDQNQIFWSTNVSNSMSNSTAMILDTGNLILQHFNATTWQSFDHPTDTLLPGMKPTVPIASGQKNILFRAWKSPSDPSDQGSFVMGIGTIGVPQCFLWNNNGLPHWRSGPWDGNNFIGLENIQNTLADGFVLEENDVNGTLDILFSPVDQSILLNYLIDYRGTIIEQYWDDSKNNWTVGWESPSTECDFYGKCGTFGTCNHRKDPICRCLRGFQPKNDGEWKRGNWSSGCVRKTQLQCGNKGGQQDGFLTLHNMKVPDYIQKQTAFSQDTCRTRCLNNCSCLAYSYHLNIGCMTWTKDLIDIAEFSAGGIDFLVRLAASDLEEDNSRKEIVIIASIVIIGTILAAILIYFIWRWKTVPGKRVKNEHKFGDNSIGLQEPPLYTFNMLRNVTNNFQETNKLGEGGFGPVYKGILEDGQIIAVKRLSRASGQGQEEFMNEVGVISKLQHRNLVKLLGCCVEGDERMLIYEYMHNKSLDVFLFDEEQRMLLPWGKRRNIIEGICRGLLYLHRDSRLRIIHRDMKASNILLDEDLNPKISDFGMARIFGGDQDQANTRRVVGTYGYMSPEYAMGQFSEKSDVYSFGVILLEIVSGRKNTTFHRTEQSLTLLGHAWKLWNESQIVSFIDPAIVDLEFETDIIRCIQVGLLCVQELAKDRPAMSTVISMLESDIEQLPYPKKPPFTDWDMSSEEQHTKTSSTNNYSVTVVEPR